MNNLSPLTPREELKQKLLETTDKKELESIVSLFNLDIAKKNVLRSATYSDMVDQIIEEMGARIQKHPGQFSNKELLEYMTALQNQLSKNAVENKEMPTIAIQQNIVNVNNPLDSFDRASKDRMRDALKAILSGTINQGDIIENGLSKTDDGIYRGVQEPDLPLQDQSSGSDDLG